MPLRGGVNPKSSGAAEATVRAMIAAQADRDPGAVAIAAPGRAPLTYAGLWSQVEDAAAGLSRMGIGAGERVATALPNGPETATALLAAMSCATCAPLNPEYRRAEYEHYLLDLRVQALIVPEGAETPAAAVASEHGIAVIRLCPVSGAEAGRFVLRGEERGPAGRPGFAAAGDNALVLHTSGTTSRPKRVPLTHANLCSAACSISAVLGLSPSDRSLAVMPLFHIHGISALLASVVAGASVACPPGFQAHRFFEWMDELRPTWYTASPTIHQSVLERAVNHLDVVERVPLRFLRSASAPMPRPVMGELETVFRAPFIEAYGMTEAAPQISSNPLPPGIRKPGSVGRPAGPEVAVMGEDGALLPPGRAGEIVVRGANVTAGYEDDPDENARAFTEGWLRTGDEGYLDEEGYLFVSGRRKEIINRGGEKVSPREVEDVLFCHPAVAQVVAFAVPHRRLGEDVAAAVVLRESAAAGERELQEYVAGQLADFKVPRRVLVVPEIAVGAAGKLLRSELAARFGLLEGAEPAARPGAVETPEPAAAAPSEHPRSETEGGLVAIWAEVLECEQVGLHDDFFQLGGDSILATQVIARVAETMGAELSFLTFFDAPTVADMARCVEECRCQR